MYSIKSRMSGNYQLNDSLNDTLDAINKKIIVLAKCKMLHIQYDLYCDCNMETYQDLMTYKKILLDKLLGCKCLKDARLITIISRIKKLLR